MQAQRLVADLSATMPIGMQVSYDRENPAVVVQRGLVLRGDRPEVDELCNSTWPLVTSRQRR